VTEDDATMGDVFKAAREESKERRAANRENGRKALDEAGVAYRVKNQGAHIIIERHQVCYVEYWPGTGRWNSRGMWKTRHNGHYPATTGRGIASLMAYLKSKGIGVRGV
jgi:hypothetical protein